MRSLAGILPGVMRDMGLAEQAAGWSAVSAWPRIAGERIAKHSRAVSYRDGVLTVEVEGSAWMQELGFLRRDMIRRIEQETGHNVVRDVRLVRNQGGHRR